MTTQEILEAARSAKSALALADNTARNAEQIIEDLGVGKPRVVRHTCKQFLDVDLIHWQIHFSSLLFFLP